LLKAGCAASGEPDRRLRDLLFAQAAALADGLDDVPVAVARHEVRHRVYARGIPAERAFDHAHRLDPAPARADLAQARQLAGVLLELAHAEELRAHGLLVCAHARAARFA